MGADGNNFGNIHATLDCGYDPIPEDAQDAVAALAWLAYEEVNRLGVRSMSVGPQHVQAARKSSDYERYEGTISYYAMKALR